MFKICLFVLSFVFSINSVMAQTSGSDVATPPPNYTAVDKQLDKMTKTLTSSKTAPEDTVPMLAELDELYNRITQANLQNNADLAKLQKKLDALGIAPSEGNEPKAIAGQRSEFNKQADEYKTAIAQGNLALNKIGDIKGMIVKLRNKKLLDKLLTKQSSIFQLKDFSLSLYNFAVFTWDMAKTPSGWYQKLNDEEKKSANSNLIYAFVYILAAYFTANYIRRFIRGRYGYSNDVLNPNYSQKVKAAAWMFTARGIIPAALIGSFMFWINNNKLFAGTPFGIMTDTAALYLLYFFIAVAFIKTALVPAYPQWRIFEIKDNPASSLSSTLIYTSAAVCLVSFFQNLAANLNTDTDILYSLTIFANAVKAFFVIFISYKFLYNNGDDPAAKAEDGTESADDDASGLSTSSKISLTISFFMLAAFAASLFGYIRLSEFVINRFIISVLVIAAAYILQKLLRALFRQLLQWRFLIKILRLQSRTRVKVNFWFGLLLTPVLALTTLLVLLGVWSASVDILLSQVQAFLKGFNIGGLHISITSILLGILTFFVSLWLFRTLKESMATGTLSQIDMSAGARNSLISATGFLGIVFSLIVSVAVMGGSFQSIAIMAGALSFGAGMGLQNTVSNLVAGFTILFERPIRIGDWVIIDGYEGIVKQINMRATEVETWNKSNVLIPNSIILSKSLVNKTFGGKMARVEIKIGVDYDSDLKKVKELLLQIAADDPDVLKTPAPSLLFTDLGDSSLDFQLNCFTNDVFKSGGISYRIREKIIEKFKENNINIPFPQRVVRQISDIGADVD
ncbi:MAG: mechanosensitive ion channel [Alphaproteobacteria bacterium]|nr:mechanosensitive ion channel [Alphaproteobacteria bacterium]